ncbi:MAG: nucleoside monophosphate kinase [Planctomycetota bacterium]|jgi:adenylate kinase|nr:nucleoside monophosphate kinase [Planctomycetota bacterium]
MSDQQPIPETTETTASGRVHVIQDPDLEIKDGQLIFNRVWANLENELGRENLRFPKEIMWLGGAPGSGKGTNTPFICRERGLTAAPVVMSSLLDSPEMKRLKDAGKLVGDVEVVDLLLRELLKDEYKSGVVVDGFPRTKVQVQSVMLLHRKMIELRRQFFNTPIGPHFRRPIFRITVLFVDERTSVDRQLGRGIQVRKHNEEVRVTGEGDLWEERATDFSEELARGRYRTFKEQTYDALTSLKKYFHYHLINAQVPLSQVERSIADEFGYQSSLELDHETYDIIHHIPVVNDVVVHARQELVRRLDHYEHRYRDLFERAVTVIDEEMVTVIRRHAITGKAHVTSQNPLFDEPTAVDMLIDVLSERGYRCMYELKRASIPERIDLQTGRISCLERRIHHFEITFSAPEIRRGH